jgi:Domain of unknown function (DUF4864)
MQFDQSALRTRFTRWVRAWAAALALVVVAVPALAVDLSPADEKNVREVVQAQLAAFAGDDGEKAFSYAAPNIRQSIGSAANFMAMVRSNYAVVYRPASVTFLKPEGKDDDALLRAYMTDANGVPWVANYSLQRQKDKLWRITGCVLTEGHARMV